MTAPALILVAEGSHDQHVAQTAHQLRKQLQILRPTISVQVCFLDHCSPTAVQVVSTLASRGTSEVVFVPLDVCRATEPSDDLMAMVDKVRGSHQALKVTVSRPIGPAPELLTILDERLRAALRVRRTSELDGLVLALPHGGDVRGNALVSRRARQWAAHHKLPVVVAFGDGSGPNVVQAIGSLRGQGRRHIAVGAVYIADCESYAALAEQAVANGAVAVSAPIGPHDRLLDLAMGRYSYAAMDLLDDLEVAAESDRFTTTAEFELVEAEPMEDLVIEARIIDYDYDVAN